MGNIRIYNRNEVQFSKLQTLASIIEFSLREACDADVTIKVEDTYFDFGQGWMWTTLIAYRGDVSKHDTYQMLYPTHMNKIVEAKTIQDLSDIAYDIIEKQYDLLTK